MNKKDYQLLVFDWDGTLMDSQAHIVDSMQSAMRDLELHVLTSPTISNVIGLGMREAVATLFPGSDGRFAEEFTAAYRRYYFAPDAPQRLFASAEETLRRLHQEGYLLAVATGKSRRGLDQSLADTGLVDLIHVSRCADETCSKPHPQMLEEILETLDVPPREAIMVGDTEYDLQMAINAGTASIAVSYGVHEPARLLKLAPLACVDSLAEIPGVLSRDAGNQSSYG